jgi:Ca2+-binding EF-hand superfamily protein
MKPNNQFKLDVNDIAIIENALMLLQRDADHQITKKEIVNILAKLYHQKNWYRPKEGYVSG